MRISDWSSDVCSSDLMVALHARLARAERPFLIVGGVLSDQVVRDITAFAEANGLPATLGFRRQDGFDQTSFCYAGDLGYGPNPPELPERVKQSDLILAVGTRPNTIITQTFTLFARLGDGQNLIHAHPDCAAIVRTYTPEIATQAGTAHHPPDAPALPP